MATPQLTDHLRTLGLIQEEADHQPRFFKANYELHTPRLLAIAQALRAELATAREELAPYEPFNPQQCARGLHADWLADSEYTHSCPWCLIAEQQEALGHAVARLAAVLAACDAAERQATRWENPLSVPEWVGTVRAAALPTA